MRENVIDWKWFAYIWFIAFLSMAVLMILSIVKYDSSKRCTVVDYNGQVVRLCGYNLKATLATPTAPSPTPDLPEIK